MANKRQVENAIFNKEGFRVRLILLDDRLRDRLPVYKWEYMARNTWTISDWKNLRLAPYRQFAKGVEVYRGNDEILRHDVRLGYLRDSYFDFHYDKPESRKVIPLKRRERKRGTLRSGRSGKKKS